MCCARVGGQVTEDGVATQLADFGALLKYKLATTPAAAVQVVVAKVVQRYGDSVALLLDAPDEERCLIEHGLLATHLPRILAEV
jgi:hypothetical protein